MPPFKIGVIVDSLNLSYKGYLTTEREEGDDRIGDVAKGIAFLQSKIN